MTNYKSTTDSRLVIDVIAPGFKPENITLSKKTINDGKNVILVVKGKYVRPRGATDKAVPRFAYDKVVPASFKEEFPIAGDFNVDAVMYKVADGVIRITVPKTAAAIGATIAPLAADANVNIVGVDADDADDDNN